MSDTPVMTTEAPVVLKKTLEEFCPACHKKNLSQGKCCVENFLRCQNNICPRHTFPLVPLFRPAHHKKRENIQK